MHIRSPKDFWSGVIFIAVALGFILLSRQYGTGTIHRMGPALFPIIIAVSLARLGLIIAARAFATDGPSVAHIQARPIIVGLGAIILFGITLQWLGLVAAVIVLVVVSAAASRESRAASSIALAA